MPLSPPPVQDNLNMSYSMQEWLRQLQIYVTGATGTIPWSTVSKSGSSIADLTNHAHSSLSSILGNGEYHLSSTEATVLANSQQSNSWTPTFTNLTLTGGTPVYTASSYTRIGRIVFFIIRIAPGGGVTSASTAGSTYATLPFTVARPGPVNAQNDSTNAYIGGGVIDYTNSRVYLPTWAATGNTISICGYFEVT